jgi:hypothetical protein
MTMTLNHDTGIDAADVTYGRLLPSEIAGMLTQQGFDVREPDDKDSTRLVITNAPKGRCQIDFHQSGLATCDYSSWAGENADPADITRAVLRLMAVPPDQLTDGPVDIDPGITLKGAAGCAARASGLRAELHLSADRIDFSVNAFVEISSPQQPSRGTILVTDDGSMLWECDVSELNGRAREFVMTLTDMLTPPVSCPGVST